MNRFNFTKVTKVNWGGRYRDNPERRQDTIRLTKKQLIVGQQLKRNFKSNLITIEKDVAIRALRIVAVQKANDDVFKLSNNKSLYTGRPKALVDMPNGNYEQDLKDPSVFVLI